ncbi:MAG: glycine zipper 2TM domain-containing protein [Xanthomonadales bacterium]|nr:glycine zipper 2TM domain-containing protein [Xanthomonadales bacterium]
MQRILGLSALLIVALLLALPVQAQRYDERYQDSGYYDVARVVDVQPLHETISQPVSSRECWREPVQYRTADRYYGPRDKTPAVLGGIIGGLIGNQIGHGRDRDIATIAGVALGAAAAHDAQRRNGGYYQRGRTVRTSQERCAVRTDYRDQQQLVGYDVTYDYQGRIGHVQTDFDPGDTIRVRIDVQAIP